MKAKTIVRTPKTGERPYFSMVRAAAQDKQLSLTARGLLAYLLSKPDDWEITFVDLKEQGIGRDQAKKLLKELRDCGYLVTEMVKDAKGKFKGKVDRVYEVPQSTVLETSILENRPTENQDIGNPQQHITDIQSTEDIAPNGASAGKKTKSRGKAKKPRQRDYIFDTVAALCFDIHDTSQVGKDGGRIGKISWWIKDEFPGATEKTIKAFVTYYDGKYPGVSRPRDVDKFKEHFLEFHQVAIRRLQEQKQPTPIVNLLDFTEVAS